MNPVQGKHKASKFEPEDFISKMPHNVVTNIMDRLPLQYAVRTGILSRNWRFKWTMLSQLVFDENFYRYLSERGREDSFGRIICRLLIHLKGAITKCVLYICYFDYAEDISHWILFLSEKGIKDLTLEKKHSKPLKLPSHLFSCLELKHLKLHNCCFNPPPSFHGFPNLLSLELHDVQFESGKFGEFFAQCPVFEILNMDYPRKMCYNTGLPKLKLSEAANLKILSLFLCNLDKTGLSGIFELMGFLPKLQELDLNFSNCKFTEGDDNMKFPTTFPCVKILKLSLDLSNGIMLSRAFQMTRSFLNLHTLEITTGERETLSTGTCSPDVDHNTMGPLQQLRRVVFTSFRALENEESLIKYLLACSPFLKKIIICPHCHLAPGEQLKFAKKLLKLQRAYPAVDIEY